MRIQNALRARIRRHLQTTDTSQSSFARMLGVTPQQVSMFLAGKRQLSMESVTRACVILGVRMSDLEEKISEPEIVAFYQAKLLELYESDRKGFDLVTGALESVMKKRAS